MRRIAGGILVTAAIAGVGSAQAAQITTVFVVAMENHNFTQPGSYTSIPQIYGNSAAPYINSLVTPGNPNAQYTSYESNNTNVGAGIHPSEPNYIAGVGGSNFGTSSDAEPSLANHNLLSNRSFLGQLTGAGVSWKNYQEDVQYSASPTGALSTSGTGGTAPSGVAVTSNPYYGTAQYNYASKHNPAVFFTDSNSAKPSTFAQLQTDLVNNTYAQFNWITPNQYNDMHSALSTNFLYNGTTYTAGTAAETVALGDNFLSQIVPLLEGTAAFQNGTALIDLWWDESEGGDTSQFTIPEILISKDAIGNAFNATGAYTHYSNLLTWEQIYGVSGCLVNACAATDQAALLQTGSFNTAQLPPDLPEPASMLLLGSGFAGAALARRRRRAV
jgi:hypothetical protein